MYVHLYMYVQSAYPPVCQSVCLSVSIHSLSFPGGPDDGERCTVVLWGRVGRSVGRGRRALPDVSGEVCGDGGGVGDQEMESVGSQERIVTSKVQAHFIFMTE